MNLPSTTRRWNRVSLSLLAVCFVFSASLRAQDAANADAILAKNIEATLSPHFKVDGPGATVIVTRDGEKFFAQRTGQGRIEILADAEDIFFAVGVDAQIRFEQGTDGKVTQMVLLQGGRETPAKRNP